METQRKQKEIDKILNKDKITSKEVDKMEELCFGTAKMKEKIQNNFDNNKLYDSIKKSIKNAAIMGLIVTTFISYFYANDIASNYVDKQTKTTDSSQEAIDPNKKEEDIIYESPNFKLKEINEPSNKNSSQQNNEEIVSQETNNENNNDIEKITNDNDIANFLETLIEHDGINQEINQQLKSSYAQLSPEQRDEIAEIIDNKLTSEQVKEVREGMGINTKDSETRHTQRRHSALDNKNINYNPPNYNKGPR